MDPLHGESPSFWRSAAGWAPASVVAVGGFDLVTGHTAHLFGALPEPLLTPGSLPRAGTRRQSVPELWGAVRTAASDHLVLRPTHLVSVAGRPAQIHVRKYNPLSACRQHQRRAVRRATFRGPIGPRFFGRHPVPVRSRL